MITSSACLGLGVGLGLGLGLGLGVAARWRRGGGAVAARQLDVEGAACARVDEGFGLVVRVEEVGIRHEEHLRGALQLTRVVEGAELLVRVRVRARARAQRAELLLRAHADEVLDVGQRALALFELLLRVLELAAVLALEQLQLRVEAAAQRRRQRLAGGPLRGATEDADRRPVDRAPQLAHDLLQLRVRARRVDDPRQPTLQLALARALRLPEARLQRLAEVVCCRRAAARWVVCGGARTLYHRPPPPKSRAQQAECLACAGRALEQRVLASGEGEHDLLHVGELHLIGLVRKLDRHAGDGVGGHGAVLHRRRPPPRAEPRSVGANGEEARANESRDSVLISGNRAVGEPRLNESRDSEGEPRSGESRDPERRDERPQLAGRCNL
eukprot:scaffold84836_cov63-Phaeocystis_antarctica.AAC.3